jgi:acyl carrier protein
MSEPKTSSTASDSADARIYAMIGECCSINPNACLPETTVFELGIDSLGLASLISHCENRLSMVFDDSTIFNIMSSQTLGQIVEILKPHYPMNGVQS